MPEMPEVETVRLGLVPVLEGRVLTHVEQRRPDLRFPFPPAFAERLRGQRVMRLHRRSKYLLADLASGETLLIHLGMSGRILVSGATLGEFHHPIRPIEKHDHVVFTTDQGAQIVFNDPRRFGAMDLFPSAEMARHPLLRDLGPEPLGNEFSEAVLARALAGRAAPIKALLLDQKRIAGLGNIYVCEALWQARLHPETPGHAVTAGQISRLTTAIVQVLRDALAAGGSSLKDFRHTDGELGYFQHHFSVYDRAGQGCLRSGCGGRIERITQSGRSSWFCPACQPVLPAD